MNLCELRDSMLQPCRHCADVREALRVLDDRLRDTAHAPNSCRLRLTATGRTMPDGTLLDKPVTVVWPGLAVVCPVCRDRGTVLTEDGRKLLQALAPLLSEVAPPAA